MKKEEPFKEERRKPEPLVPGPRLPALSSSQKSGPGGKAHQLHAPPMAPPGAYGSHKDIKLTLLNKVIARVFRRIEGCGSGLNGTRKRHELRRTPPRLRGQPERGIDIFHTGTPTLGRVPRMLYSDQCDL